VRRAERDAQARELGRVERLARQRQGAGGTADAARRSLSPARGACAFAGGASEPGGAGGDSELGVGTQGAGRGGLLLSAARQRCNSCYSAVLTWYQRRSSAVSSRHQRCRTLHELSTTRWAKRDTNLF
jgi:hypothetical protein